MDFPINTDSTWAMPLPKWHISRLLPVAEQSKSCLDRLISRLVNHIQLDTRTTGMTPLNEWSVRRRGRYRHNSQQTQETNIHALNRFRRREPGIQEAADKRLWPHGHQDRHIKAISHHNFSRVNCIIIMLRILKITRCALMAQRSH
jgi:hypothetical protein